MNNSAGALAVSFKPICGSSEVVPAARAPRRQPGGAGTRASLSQCHNSDEGTEPGTTSEKRLLSGSYAKTAIAIQLNAEEMVETAGIEKCGFLTLTIGDHVCHEHGRQIPRGNTRFARCPRCRKPMQFQQVYEAAEASRRFDSLRRGLLPQLFARAVVVSERHKSGALHFHILGVLASGVDIRTGFHWRGLGQRSHRAGCRWLKDIWIWLRLKLPRYGFGRAELTPIRKDGGAVACYVAKYLEKNVHCRRPGDKRKKLVRYLGFEQRQLKPNNFEWNSEAANNWRSRARAALELVGIPLRELVAKPDTHLDALIARGQGRIRPKCLDGSIARQVLGPRWAYLVSSLLDRLQLCDGAGLKRDYLARQLLSAELQRAAGRQWCHEVEHPLDIQLLGETYTPSQWREMWDGLPMPAKDASLPQRD